MGDFTERATQRCKELFGIDVRSLAVFRIFISLIIIGDLIIRAGYLRTFYTDFGVLPRFVLNENFSSLHWSIHSLSGSAWFQAFLFVIAFLFAIMLLFGYKTRFATIASWILLVSIQNRNPIVLQGGDTLFRMLLFWAMFLPLGKIFSVDSFLGNFKKDSNQDYVLSFATLGILLQMVFLYFFSALLKTGKEWHSESSAVYYALQIDQFTTPLGYFLLGFPTLLIILTKAVWWIELAGPLLFFSPAYTKFVRTAMVGVFLLLQLGMGLSLRLGPFPFVSSAGILLFLPSSFWEFLSSKTKSRGERISVVFDGECRFCERMVNIILGFLMLSKAKTLPAQSNKLLYSEMLSRNSWIVIDSYGKRFYKSSGFYPLLKNSPLFFWLAWILSIKPVNIVFDLVYDIIANKRRKISFLLFPSKEKKDKKILLLCANLAAAFFLVYILAWNVQTLGNDAVPDNSEIIASILRLDQKWDMFAPAPLKDDGWYVISGNLSNGKEVDLFENKDKVEWGKPERVALTYDNQRWRKYMMNLWKEDYSQYRGRYAEYLCRNWNDRNSEEKQLISLTIVFMKETSLALGFEQKQAVEKVVLLEHNCGLDFKVLANTSFPAR